MNLTVETKFGDDSLRDLLWYCCFWSILTQVFMAIWNQEVSKILKGKLFIVRIEWFECCRNNVYVFHLTAKLIFYENRLEMIFNPPATSEMLFWNPKITMVNVKRWH